MTNTKGHRRNTSWANTALPPIFYETESAAEKPASAAAAKGKSAQTDVGAPRRSFRRERDSLTLAPSRPR